VVALRPAKVGAVLGAEVPAAECAQILSALGFTQTGGGDVESTWAVPMARVDVSIEEDLIEEIARVRGYELIPNALPRGLSELLPERPQVVVERRVRAALAGQGIDEVVNYSFVAPLELEAFGAAAGAIAVANPLSVEQSVMRTTLYASLVPNVVRSTRHQATGVRFYELGRSYRPQEGGGQGATPVASERLEAAGVLWGVREGATSWTAKDAACDFYDAKAAVEGVLRSLHIEGAVYEPLDSPWYHPRAAATVRHEGRVLGTLGELHPRAQKRLDAPAGVFLFQLDVEALVASARLVPQAAALSRYPAVLRDLAVVVDQAMASQAVREVILEVGRPLVTDARVFDVYTGPQLGAGRKNLAFALTYRAPERTLTDAEVADAHAKIVAEVTSRLGGSLRT
jgi:phenylalanyl-tRNA synthetase beta chain